MHCRPESREILLTRDESRLHLGIVLRVDVTRMYIRRSINSQAEDFDSRTCARVRFEPPSKIVEFRQFSTHDLNPRTQSTRTDD